MNIPYYYNSGYEDDGVDVYTCLQCGAEIAVRSWYKPNFCSHCGVKYEGKKENIGNNSKRWHCVCFVEEFYWAIEEREVELWGEPLLEPHWKEKGYYRLHKPNFGEQGAKKILAEKRRFEEEDRKEAEEEIRKFKKCQDMRREKDPNFDKKKDEWQRPMTATHEYRILRKKEFQRHSALVRKDRYLEKTGKEFNEHEDRIPYGAKEEITTGIKFLKDQMICNSIF
jgi:hypothetical protein